MSHEVNDRKDISSYGLRKALLHTHNACSYLHIHTNCSLDHDTLSTKCILPRLGVTNLLFELETCELIPYLDAL